MDLRDADIFVTGGAGTLGRAIAARRESEGWTGEMTVFSRDTTKHSRMRQDFPDINYVCGDIRDYTSLYNAMAGHNVVIHAGAVKVIPVSEYDVLDTISVNVTGSQNVLRAAVELGVEAVMGISTDKAAHPCNAYGATKFLMEKLFQEYHRKAFHTNFYLVRYGNVLESTGSVIEAWNKALKAGKMITITDETMTRFWLSPKQAVDVIVDGFEKGADGCIYVPEMPSLSIKKLAEYTLPQKTPFTVTGIRPGEKLHEELVTKEETAYTYRGQGYYIIHPTTGQKVDYPCARFASDIADELTPDDLKVLLNG